MLFAGLGVALFVASRGNSSVSAGVTPPVASDSESAPEVDDAPPPASAWSPEARALRGPARGDPLEGFHAALVKLTAAKGPKHVRVLFFGDSHTQGESLPNALREALQTAYGDGGPGFLYAGDHAHRNDASSQRLDGAWQITPKAPSSPLKQGDGVFGLGGILTSATTGTAHVGLTPHVAGRMRVDVCARSPSGRGRILVHAGAATPFAFTPKAGPTHETFVVPEPGAIELEVSGDAELCGVVMERADEPGVVLDSLGIAGARFGTPLAWDEPTFTAEVARRAPDLVVLEYGTNESAEPTLRPEHYAKDATDLIARVRRAAPNTDCVVVGPTEIEANPDAVAVVSPAFEAAAERAGCAFWDTYHTMGGPGAMHAWRTSDNPLAQADGIHLTGAGYKKLGTLLAADILSGLKPADAAAPVEK